MIELMNLTPNGGHIYSMNETKNKYYRGKKLKIIFEGKKWIESNYLQDLIIIS